MSYWRSIDVVCGCGLTLDSKLSFNEHINDKTLQAVLPRTSLSTIHKSFIRPLLCGCDLWPTFQKSFSENIELVQCNAALAITGAIKGLSCKTLHRELGLEEDGREDCAYSIKFFQLVSHPIFMIYYHQWEVLVDMLIRLIRSHANLNMSRALAFLMQLMNGINWILKFAVCIRMTYFVIHY